MATQVIVYRTDRNGNPILGPAKVAKVMGNRRRWTIVGYRANVSATVLERFVSVDFTTKRDATAFLREYAQTFNAIAQRATRKQERITQ